MESESELLSRDVTSFALPVSEDPTAEQGKNSIRLQRSLPART